MSIFMENPYNFHNSFHTVNQLGVGTKVDSQCDTDPK